MFQISELWTRAGREGINGWYEIDYPRMNTLLVRTPLDVVGGSAWRLSFIHLMRCHPFGSDYWATETNEPINFNKQTIFHFTSNIQTNIYLRFSECLKKYCAHNACELMRAFVCFALATHSLMRRTSFTYSMFCANLGSHTREHVYYNSIFIYLSTVECEPYMLMAYHLYLLAHSQFTRIPTSQK